MASDSEKSGLVPQMSGEDAFVELHCLLDTSVASIGHHTAAERALGRLVLNTSAACDWLTSSVGSISQTVSQAVESNGQKAKRLRASRDKRLDWLCEEFEAAKVVLEAVYLQLGSIFESNIIDLDNTLVASLGAVEELVTRTNTFATHSSVVLAGDSAFVVSAFDEISHIQTGVDGACSVVSHPPRLCRSEENRVFVACKDLFGDCVRTVRLEDVIVGVSESGDWIVRGPTVEDGTVTVSVVASTESTQSARALTLLFDVSCTRIEVHLQVHSLEGTYVRTLQGPSVANGLAIRADGALMVASCWRKHTISVYSLPSGELQAEFGGFGDGPGQFNCPQKLCFSPLREDHVFIADSENSRVQEMTLAGAHVRSICSELIVREHRAMCVDASMDLVVVGLLKNARLIVSSVGVFGMCSGDLIRTFGIDTIDPGHLSWSGKRGIRLTSDGNHVMFAEGEQGRLTLFTLTGELVRCINTFDFSCGEPVDVSFTRAGDIVVADHWCRGDGRSLFVLTPDGSSLLQSFGSRDRFVRASALAVHGGLLYALDQRKGVHVFN